MGINYKQLLAGYLAGELTAAQEAVLFEWVNGNAQNLEVFTKAKEIWELSAHRLLVTVEVDMALEWRKLTERVSQQPTFGESVFAQKVVTEKQKNRRSIEIKKNISYWQMAAMFTLLVGVSYILSRQFSGFNSFTAHTVTRLQASKDSLRVFYLPDSTRVWLNTSSTLSYQAPFEGKERKVELSGEAFFEVKRDESRPFIVLAAHTQTKVLGTSFHIRTSLKGQAVEINVVSGKVAFSEKVHQKQRILSRQEKAICNEKDHKIVRSKNVNQDFLLWRKKNNSVYEQEKRQASLYLKNSFVWEKNRFNQTLIEGEVLNQASLASYKSLRLRCIIYTKLGTKKVSTIVLDTQSIAAGQTIHYKKRLLDVFTKVDKITVELENAQVDGQ